MLNLTPEHYNQIYALLEPLVETTGEQRALINSIFIGVSKRPAIQFGTTGWEFARHVVIQLHDYHFADGTNALAALLESIKSRVDWKKQAQIDVLVRRIQPPERPARKPIRLPSVPFVFVSYSRKDTTFLTRLLTDLKPHGVTAWLDTEDLTPGTPDWEAAIRAAIQTCMAVLYVASPDSRASEYVRDELDWALEHDKRIVPVWAAGKSWIDSVPLGWGRRQNIDLRGDAYNDANVVRLAAALKGEPHPPTPSPTGEGEIALPKIDVQPASAPQTEKIARPNIDSLPRDLPSPIWRGAGGEVARILPPPFAWCDVTAGSVEIEGHGKFDVAAFQIAKYPITNAQYQVFIDAGGYQDERWWTYSPDAKAFWERKGKQPENTRFEGDTDPRTNVSWYEAVAFCQWLSFETGMTIRLPHEAEWQRAAQGDDGRVYPWGNRFDKNRCNTAESSIKRTTHVTRYDYPPEDKRSGWSPFGAADMAGNVWEWCLNEYDTPRHRELSDINSRAVRGGSWGYFASRARSANRNWYDPFDGDYLQGFRVCCVGVLS